MEGYFCHCSGSYRRHSAWWRTHHAFRANRLIGFLGRDGEFNTNNQATAWARCPSFVKDAVLATDTLCQLSKVVWELSVLSLHRTFLTPHDFSCIFLRNSSICTPPKYCSVWCSLPHILRFSTLQYLLIPTVFLRVEYGFAEWCGRLQVNYHALAWTRNVHICDFLCHSATWRFDFVVS